MKNPLILNIRCVCIDEYMELQRIHNNYRKLRSEGEILSIYVGARRELYGQNKIVDKLLDKVFSDKSKPIPTERIMREHTVAAQGNGDGTVTETVERTFVPPEKPLTVDEARAIGAGYAEQEEASEPEVAFDPNVEDYHPERGDSWKGAKTKPEITLTDVLTAMAEEPDPMEAMQPTVDGENTEAEGEPDGADWSTSAGC